MTNKTSGTGYAIAQKQVDMLDLSADKRESGASAEATNLMAYVAEALRSASKVNRTLMVPPAAILWTDAERQWEGVIPNLTKLLPELFRLGAYSPDKRQGPSIWLKCAVAGKLDVSLPGGAVPIVYLPGIARADLRAIEDCPRDLQPLAELQFRGNFWSQTNAKDWTLNALLSSKSGGLRCDVAQDKATQVALKRALDAGVLLECSLEELRSHLINAAWLDALLAPNPARDILYWLNAPQEAQAQWAGGRWDIFVSRCKKDFNFEPQSEGVHTAAENLAARAGAWSAIWELYRDSYTSFPNIAEQLAGVQPPALKGLFDDINDLAGYPRANDGAEDALRYKLFACGAMAPALARATLLDAEKEHASRRDWLWASMERAPLARALQHLAQVATMSEQIPGGATVELMAARYLECGWQVDAGVVKALAAVQSKADTDAVGAALRAVYTPWLEDTAHRFQELVKAEGRLSHDSPKAPMDTDGLCTVFVDGLRYDVAMMLKERLGVVGEVTSSSAWTSIPSVTASGKAWASPVAHAISGKMDDEDFQPSVAADGKPLTTYNLRKLLADYGWQVLSKHETGDTSGRAWVECGDLDHYGHEHGLRLARDMDNQLRQIIERLLELKEAGWRRFRIVTDHGWLLMPGGLPKSALSKFEAQTRWGRCAVLKDSSHGTALTFGWDWCKDVQIAFAPGISNFIAGAEYAHGGLTLQECLVPVLDVQVEGSLNSSSKSGVTVSIQRVTWKGLRCAVEVAPDQLGLSVDIRTKATQSDTSLVAKVKPIEGGKVSVVVANEDHAGVAAVIVVLDAAGLIVQRAPTTIGD